MPNELKDYSYLGVEVEEPKSYSNLEAVPVEKNFEISTYKPTPKQNFIDNLRTFFGSKETDIANAQNVYSLSEVTGLSLKDTSDNYELLLKSSKVTGLTPHLTDREYLGIALLPAIAGGAVTAPFKIASQLIAFGALDKVINTDKIMSGFEETTGINLSGETKNIVNIVSDIGKMLLIKGVTDIAPALAEAFTRGKLIEYKMPTSIKLSKAQVRDIFQTGKLTTAEEKALFASLNLEKGTPIKTALEKGVTIEVPAEKLIHIVDKPWWGKVKGIFGMESKVQTTVDMAGKPTQAVSGLIGAVEPLPEVPAATYADLIKTANVETVQSEISSLSKTFSILKARSPELAADTKAKLLLALDRQKELYAEEAETNRLKTNVEIFGQGEQPVGELKPPTEGKVEAEPPIKPPEPPKTAVEEPIGETKVSGLAKGVETSAIEKKLTQGFEGLSEYETINIKDQSQKAVDIVNTNPEQAKRIAMGEEEPPAGVKSFAVYTAVEAKAQKEGDVGTLLDLATRSGLNVESSGAAQTLRLLAERDPESPVTAIKEIAKAREATNERRLGKNIKKIHKEEVGKLKEEIKKVAPSKNEWSDFIKSLQC